MGYQKVTFGLSADIEKRKLGAKQLPKSSYVQAKDNFNFELLEAILRKVDVTIEIDWPQNLMSQSQA